MFAAAVWDVLGCDGHLGRVFTTARDGEIFITFLTYGRGGMRRLLDVKSDSVRLAVVLLVGLLLLHELRSGWELLLVLLVVGFELLGLLVLLLGALL